LLNEKNVAFTYRDYDKEPLDAAEIRAVLAKLHLTAADVLRSRDAAKAGVSAADDEDTLIAAMAANNALLQRPIGVAGDRAVMGRPVENLLELG
jgi:arsenate reductase